MGKIVLTPARLSVETGEDGTAIFSMRVPGVFNGLIANIDGTVSGRFLAKAEFRSDSGDPGDTLSELQVRDDQGLIPVPARVQFPEYPIIRRFGDANLTGKAESGMFLWADHPTVIHSLDHTLEFIASGLLFTGTFQTGAGQVAGKKIRANFIWGTWSAVG